jgi:hypothetical protein
MPTIAELADVSGEVRPREAQAIDRIFERQARERIRDVAGAQS